MKIILDEKRADGEEYKTKILMDADAANALNDLMDARIKGKLKTYGLPVDNDEDMYELFRSLRKGNALKKIVWESIIKEVTKYIITIALTYLIIKKAGL